jgi:peptidoglycan lytic transglycosylase
MKPATVVALFLVLSLAACGGHEQAKVKVPPPPPISTAQAQSEPATSQPSQPKSISDLPQQQAELQKQQQEEEKQQAAEEQHLASALPPEAKPLEVETGIASWYGAPYHNRRGSNGEIYDMNAMTAAHRTLPLGTIVRVTNLKTGSTALVRITDRGPFIKGRILDLSQAAAKKLDVYRAGLAEVKLEVMQTPVPLDASGRWAVQIGGFDKEEAARDLAGHLEHRYHSAKVLCFNSPVGDWWVRVRVPNDDEKRAQEIAKDTHTSEGAIFLVRLD